MRRIALFSIFLLLFFSSCTHKSEYIMISGYTQGGIFSVKLNLYKADGHKINKSTFQLKKDIDSILSLIDTSLSTYNPNSMISRFNRGENIVPNRLFIDIYKISYDYWKESKGALDVASGPIYNIWGFGHKKGKLPQESEIQHLLQNYGMQYLKDEITCDANALFNGKDLLKNSKDSLPELNYNAIAQGYSSDMIANYLYSLGVKDMLVDIGESYCAGLNPNGKPWAIGIDSPIDGNNNPGADIKAIWHSEGKSCGIVTSGNYRKYYIFNGVKYAHTIDPRTGYPVQHNLLSATIVAPSACAADAYATYCMVIGLEESIKFINSKKELEAYLIYKDIDGNMKSWKSEGFTSSQE